MAGLVGKGVSVSYRPPVVTGAGEKGNLTGELGSLSFSTDAVMGFKSARISSSMHRRDAEDWIGYGLARDVRIRDEGANIVWEGFVDRIEAQLGTFNISRGPVTGLSNRTWVTYTLRDASVNPPVVIPGRPTTVADDARSQALYGVWEKMIPKGECLASEAQQERDRQLAQYAWPRSSGDLPLGEPGNVRVTIECKGYCYWLKAYPYADANAGTVTVKTKLQYVLAADPNGIFSADYSRMNANAALAGRSENSGSDGWTVAEALAGIGDGTGNRWLFGVYEGRRAEYRQAPTGITYEYLISEKEQRVHEVGVGEVHPWQMRPGRWMKVLNLLTSQTNPEQGRAEDLRFVFIERVTYNSPYMVTLTGARRSQLGQMIALKGFRGMGD